MALTTRVLNMPSAVPSRHPKYRSEFSRSKQRERELITTKAKLCRRLASGDCPFGEKCNFLHPAPSTDPSSSAPPSHLFNWNPLLLAQFLALSDQQGNRKEMLRQSPPRSQAPQLVDEDPSPSTSLLFSKSDSTSSLPTWQSNKPKKFPCRHFVRTGGWCPAGGHCRL